MITRYSQNENGRDFVVGDIHGCFTILELELLEAGFDETKDRLFSVGDLVDRGQESKAAIDWLAKPWFHAVLGNHEQMAIEYIRGKADPVWYIQNGGLWFIEMTGMRVV